MRLTKIKLAGFKSFVEPTVVPVTDGLVGIVGPNGCGKSNIIDAVRWVLGESKASALRGDSIQDVIFGGSSSRKPVGRASVELFFDNHLGTANGQWSSYAEIAIKRIIQRDSGSSYYINNLHVRRRDITDLFLGTGIGGRGYAIIEQGMISRIIEAKPQELKMYLEEAAGISKYRERRHETELRLTDTRKNLMRVEDIVRELRQQIEHLEIQAEVAQRYTALNNDLHRTQHTLWLQQRNTATKQRIAVEEEIKQLEQTLAIESEQLQQNRQSRDTLRDQEHTLNAQLHDIQGQLYGAAAEKTRIEQEILQFQKHKARLAQQIADLDKQLTANRQHRKSTSDHLDHWRKDGESSRREHEAGLLRHDSENKKLPELETGFQQHQQAFEALQRDLTQTEQSISLALTHIQHADKLLLQLQSRGSRLKHDLEALHDTDYTQIDTLQTQIGALKTQLDDIEHHLNTAETAYGETSQQKEAATIQVNTARQAQANLQAQFNALQTLQQKIDNNEALKQWLQKHRLDVQKRLWHHIQIDPAWENALESILHERLNSLVFEQLEAIHDWKGDLPPGKLSVFEQPRTSTDSHPARKSERRTATGHPGRTSLLTFVQCRDDHFASLLNHWLDTSYVVENVDDALQQRQQLATDECLVTREGHIVTSRNILFHSPDSHLHGVLSRQSELDQIQSEIAMREKDLHTQQSALAETTAQHEQLAQTIQSQRQQQQQLIRQRHALQIEHTKQAQIKTQTQLRRTQIAAELKELEAQSRTEFQDKQDTERIVQAHRTQCETLKTQLQQAKIARDTAAQSLNDQRAKIQETLKAAQEAGFNEKICQNKINDLEQALQVGKAEEEKLSEHRTSLSEEAENLSDSEFNAQLDNCVQSCRELEDGVTQHRNRLDELRQQIRTIEERSLAAEQTQIKLRESISQLYLKKQACVLSEERYNEQLLEANADEESLLPFTDQRTDAALQTDVNRLQKTIAALGSVNLAALDELESARLRESKLDAQIQDLSEASTLLQDAIDQIDQETKKRLKKTFDAVNNHLQELFPVIFSGGKAELILSDDKILEAGVTLTAQPPGKKNNSLHLLSGGEKALTALALIFSLFRLNPAPFCLLDEVDAPLDDSNTARFCELVKKLSTQTQFLFISHNKITMEIAQQLIGITMQEQGVSRVVAVNIAQMFDSGKKEDVAAS